MQNEFLEKMTRIDNQAQTGIDKIDDKSHTSDVEHIQSTVKQSNVESTKTECF